jgi:hypothetical protein
MFLTDKFSKRSEIQYVTERHAALNLLYVYLYINITYNLTPIEFFHYSSCKNFYETETAINKLK